MKIDTIQSIFESIQCKSESFHDTFQIQTDTIQEWIDSQFIWVNSLKSESLCESIQTVMNRFISAEKTFW